MGIARLPPELKAKIAPLLRLQASDNDNERANASAAIGRLLQRAGADWHDLTEALLAEPVASPAETPPPPSSSWKRSAGPIELPREQLLALLDVLEATFLPVKSREFVSSLRGQAWRPTVNLSEKQWRWLQDLLQATGV